MNDKMLKDTAKKHVPKQTKGKNACIAFISGGIMGLIGQTLLQVYGTLGFEKEAALSLMVVTVIFVTALLTKEEVKALFMALVLICSNWLVPLSHMELFLLFCLEVFAFLCLEVRR